MFSHPNLERFKVSKEQLAKLGSEFNSEALPMLDTLYQTTFWIVLDKKFSKKIIKQTFFEAIEYCNVTKNLADWQSWIYRIWMREILDFYVNRENDIQTIFDFIDHTTIEPSEVSSFSNANKLLIKHLGKIPAVLRIPLIMKEVNSLNYQKIAELIDVPEGVIATRIYRARKLIFLSFRENFDFEEKKRKWGQRESSKIIFELRKCALFVDDELTEKQKSDLTDSSKSDNQLKIELLVQSEIKKLFVDCSSNSPEKLGIKSWIEKKARKKFG